MLPLGASVVLLVVHAVSAAIWVGGLVAIFVVARAASATLDAGQRIAFFRALGRAYGIVGGLALLVALASGAVLLDDHPWDGLLTATAIVAGCLLAVTVAGIAQTKAMTRSCGCRQQASSDGGLRSACNDQGAEILDC